MVVIIPVAGYSLVAMLVPSQIVTLQEPSVALGTGYSLDSDQASAYLKQHYEGGTILMESFGNELVLFKAGIVTVPNLYEGSFRLWEPALADPAGNDIHWIVMRGTDQADKVYQTLNGTPTLDSYRLVYQNDTYYVYEVEQ